ncbi:MAG: nuclear transport factor 2 family protein [Chitinophagaceae bacterium]|nr:nuclear transport factor 2 family protein [Chitinophagaceae bacterium]
MRLILCTIMVITCFVANAQSNKQKSVESAIEQLRKTMIEPNKKQLESIVADELSYGHSSGAIDSKEVFIDKLVSGKSDFVTIELSNQTIRITGNTAIVRHTLEATTNDNGQPGKVSLKVLLVWQKSGNGWKLLARQAVKPA